MRLKEALSVLSKSSPYAVLDKSLFVGLASPPFEGYQGKRIRTH